MLLSEISYCSNGEKCGTITAEVCRTDRIGQLPPLHWPAQRPRPCVRLTRTGDRRAAAMSEARSAPKNHVEHEKARTDFTSRSRAGPLRLHGENRLGKPKWFFLFLGRGFRPRATDFWRSPKVSKRLLRRPLRRALAPRRGHSPYSLPPKNHRTRRHFGRLVRSFCLALRTRRR